MTKIQITTTVNGDERDLLVEPGWTLLRVLRDELLLTGTKEGCSNGNCGACTVIIDGKTANSCLVLAPEADGREITTIEGIAIGAELNAVQQAFLQDASMQCGFCTPGFIVATTALLRGNPTPSEEEIRLGLAGNLCRCTGYDKIVKGVQDAAASLEKQGARL